LLFLNFVLCFFLGNDLVAQELAIPSEIYPKGYVVEQKPKNTNSRDTIVEAEEFFDKGSVVESEKEKQDNITSVTSVNSEETSVVKRGEPITALGGILDAQQREHFRTELAKLIGVASDNNIVLGKVYAIGPISSIIDKKTKIPFADRKEMFKFAVMEGLLYPSEEIPERYNIKLSPTWIIRTEKGEILLEGIGNLASFINERGEFIDKSFGVLSNVLETEEEKEEKRDKEDIKIGTEKDIEAGAGNESDWM